MATASATLSITGVSRLDSRGLRPGEFKKSGLNTSQLAFPLKAVASKPRRSLSVSAQYDDESRSGGGDFVAGFILGGALFGTLAYVFAPQIRKSILNEDEYGFRRAKRPIYYDEGLEKTRQTLNAKISQLNSAIDNVSSRLRGGNNAVREAMETDSKWKRPCRSCCFQGPVVFDLWPSKPVTEIFLLVQFISCSCYV